MDLSSLGAGAHGKESVVPDFFVFASSRSIKNT